MKRIKKILAKWQDYREEKKIIRFLKGRKKKTNSSILRLPKNKKNVKSQIECVGCGIYINYVPETADMKLCDDCLREEYNDIDLKIKSYKLGEITIS